VVVERTSCFVTGRLFDVEFTGQQCRGVNVLEEFFHLFEVVGQFGPAFCKFIEHHPTGALSKPHGFRWVGQVGSGQDILAHFSFLPYALLGGGYVQTIYTVVV